MFRIKFCTTLTIEVYYLDLYKKKLFAKNTLKSMQKLHIFCLKDSFLEKNSQNT